MIMAKFLGICLLMEVSLTNLQRSAAAAGFASVWPEVFQNSRTFWILLSSCIRSVCSYIHMLRSEDKKVYFTSEVQIASKTLFGLGFGI